MTEMPTRLTAATRATYVAFIASGFAFASWASRIPQVRDRLHLTSASLGLVLLAVAFGSLISLPLAGAIVHRIGSRRTVEIMSVLLAAGLVVAAIGYLTGVVTVGIGLVIFGFANGAWDVAMNVQGATVERQRGAAIMPRFHAGWSIGTVAGALVGAAMVALQVPVTAHLVAVAVVVAATVPLAVRSFLADVDEGAEVPEAPVASAFSRWLEPRTVLIGVFVLAFAFAEGAGNDWISVSFIDGHHARPVFGTLGFAVFVAAMTIGRWCGPALLDRYGRVVVLRSLAAVAVAGLVLYVFAPAILLAYAGIAIWGLGTSLGFPVGMSAAADEPAAAAGRVSVVASIGYFAFLGGPPLIGFVGEQVTVLRALLTVAVLLAVASAVAGALRPPVGAAQPDADARAVR
jgi:MFS family permease